MMKKHIPLIFLFCLVFSFSLQAQSYIVNKYKYNYKTYSPEYGDPYSPAVAGFASFFVPGLGQMICHEGGRGATFLIADIGCMVLYFGGVMRMAEDINSNGYYTGNGEGSSAVLAGLVGGVIIEIWSIVDAVRVAKVTNLYLRDQNRKTGMNLGVKPYIDTDYMQLTNKVPVGLSLNLTF